MAEQTFRPSLDKGNFFQLKEIEFCWFILAPVASMVYHSTNKEQALSRLSDGQKALYYWWFLENQSIGVFEYFFKNGYYEYLPNLVEGMKVINHKEAVQILNDLIKEIEIIDDGGEIADEVLNESFSKYNEISQEITLHFEKYIRANPNDFLVAENGKKLTEDLAGAFKTYYSSGQLKNHFSMKYGILDGNFKLFSNKGILLKEEFYEQGVLKDYIHYKKDGTKDKEKKYLETGFLHIRYDEKGYKLDETHHNKNGERHGLNYDYYYNTGILKSEKRWKNGRHHGPYKEYYKNGDLQSTGTYTNHKRITINHWNEKGNQTIIDGAGSIVYENKESTEKTVINYRNGQANGKSYTYRNGKLASFQTSKNGELTGEAKYYDEAGDLMREEVLENGNIVSSIVYKLDVQFNDFALLIKPQIPEKDYPKILKILGLAAAQYKGIAPKKDISDNRIPGVYISQINGVTLIMGYEEFANWKLRTTTFIKKEKEIANLYPNSTLFFIHHFQSSYQEAFHYIKNGGLVRVYEAYTSFEKSKFCSRNATSRRDKQN